DGSGGGGLRRKRYARHHSEQLGDEYVLRIFEWRAGALRVRNRTAGRNRAVRNHRGVAGRNHERGRGYRERSLERDGASHGDSELDGLSWLEWSRAAALSGVAIRGSGSEGESNADSARQQ